MPYYGIAERMITAYVALGATLGGMARQFIKAVATSTKKAIEMIQLTKKHIDVTILRRVPLHSKIFSPAMD